MSFVTSSSFTKAMNKDLTSEQNKVIETMRAAGADATQIAQTQAQMALTNMQNLIQFISNVMRIMADISKGIVQNIR